MSTESLPNDKGFTKPAITRLARRAGVKSMADECVVPLKNLLAIHLDKILYNTVIVNSQHATKTIMPEDFFIRSFLGILTNFSIIVSKQY